MSDKLPFKISFYLDKRHVLNTTYTKLDNLDEDIFRQTGQRLDKQFHLKKFNDPKFRQGAIQASKNIELHTLYIQVYSRLEQKKKLYKVDTMTRQTWEDVQNFQPGQKGANSPHSLAIFQKSAVLFKEMERFQKCNGIKDVVTLDQFNKELTKGVKSLNTTDSYLIRIWDGYYGGRSDASESHKSASRKSIFSFINEHLKKNALTFMVQDIDKAFIEKYVEWYTNKPTHNSRNSAISYLTDLRTIINYAIRLGVISKELNPFGKKNEGKYQLPKKTTRSKQYTLSPKQLSDFLNATPANEKQQKARDIFALLFLMNGIRIIDLIRLRKQNIKETQGQKYFEILAKKTDGSNKTVEVAITPQIEELISRHPGSGDYILDILPYDLPYIESNRVGRNKYRKLVEHLKAFSSSVEGLPSISWSYTRFSANNFLHVNSYASRSLIAEMQGNTYQVNQGYSHDVNYDKFKVQEKLNDVFVKSDQKKSLGENNVKEKKNETTN